MLTLDQLGAKADAIAANTEKRVPISSLPFTITAPGSYYFTQTLTATGTGDGITVKADNVTIDLNGFALIGTGTGNYSGIVSDPASQFTGWVTIRNGVIRKWGSCGIGRPASDITLPPQFGDSTVENLKIIACVSTGISTGFGCIVRNCVTTGNGTGIQVGSGSSVHECVSNADTTALRADVDSEIVHCVATSGSDGIRTAAACRVENCTVTGTKTNGITVDRGSTVRNCSVRGNYTGIYVYTGFAVVSGNTCESNQSVGIYVAGNYCRIEGNNCTGNGTYGIQAAGSGNLVIRNASAANNTAAYNLAANTAFGSIVHVEGPNGGQIPDSAGGNANISY